ncbi:MAG: AI-2E family transporter [Deltaproteobacteria bacterium]|nr:AI-2E family transporter [Deltaproteobacteria bacterium]
MGASADKDDGPQDKEMDQENDQPIPHEGDRPRPTEDENKAPMGGIDVTIRASSGEINVHPLIPLFRSASPLRVAMLLLVLTVLCVLGYFLRSVAGPLLVASALAYVFAPIVDRAQRVGVPRTATALAIALGVVLTAAGVVALVVPLAVAQATRLLHALPANVDALVLLLRERFPAQFPEDASQVLFNAWSGVKARAPELLGAVGRYSASIVASGAGLLSMVGSFLLVPLFMFFFLREWSSYRQRALVLLPAPMQAPVGAKLHQIGETISAYVRGIFTVGSILAVVYAVGLSLIGVPLGFLIGVLSGYAYAVPFASPIIGVGLSVLVSLLDSPSLGQLVAIVGLFSVGGAIEGFVLTPRIVGEFVGLSPLAVIVSVLVSGALFGVSGVLVALPVAAILNVIVRDLIELWKSSRLYQSGLTSPPTGDL